MSYFVFSNPDFSLFLLLLKVVSSTDSVLVFYCLIARQVLDYEQGYIQKQPLEHQTDIIAPEPNQT